MRSFDLDFKTKIQFWSISFKIPTPKKGSMYLLQYRWPTTNLLFI